MKLQVRLNALLPVTTTVEVNVSTVTEAIGAAIRKANTMKLLGDTTSLLGIGDLGWDASPAIDHNHLHEITVEEVADDEGPGGYKVLWNQTYLDTMNGV